MEINTALNSSLNTMQNTVSDKISSENTAESAPQLSLPKSVRAFVADLIRDELTLSLPDGSNITAKAANLKNLSIGLEAEFKLSSDNSGNIIAQLSDSKSASDNIASSTLSNALVSLGIKASPENLNMANILLQNEFPVTKENFALLNRAMKMTDNTPDKALFFMNNNLSLTTKSVQQLNSYINHETKLSSQLENIVDTIKSMPDSDLKSKLLSLFSDKVETASPEKPSAMQQPLQNKSAEASESDKNIDSMIKNSEDKISSTPDKAADKALKSLLRPRDARDEESEQALLREKIVSDKSNESIQGKSFRNRTNNFSLDLKNLSSENVDKLFSKLSENLDTAKELLSSLKNDTARSLSENIDSLKENINFMSAMRDTSFVQLPIIINNVETTADLYVFNNKKNKRKSSGNSANALLSLDLAFLGHLEVYIQKNNSNVDCQFRLDDDNIQALIKTNMNRLSAYLGEHSLRLASCSFKTLDTPFSITGSESSLTDSSLENEIKKITFDMRT